MEKYNQLITDIVIVCVAPVVIVLGYRFFLADGAEFSDELLSAQSEVATPGDSTTLGEKSKQILKDLESIHFDGLLFEDKAFLSLYDFTPPYYSTSTGREYPFTTPDEVRALEKKFDNVTEDSPKPKATTTPSGKKTPQKK